MFSDIVVYFFPVENEILKFSEIKKTVLNTK